MSDILNEDFINKLPIAYAKHKIIFDAEGKAVDYMFLEVNDAFEKQTSLKKDEVVGKMVTEIFPSIKEDNFDWVKTYGDVVKNNQILEFDEYSELLNKWYHIYAYSQKENCFITMFFDISETIKKTEEQLTMYTMLNDIIIELDENYIVKNMMAPNESFLFAPIKETMEKNLIQSLPPEHSKLLFGVLERAKVSDKMETTYYSSSFNGEKRWFQADVKFIEINKKFRYVISVRDITDKRILEKKLSDREMLFSTIFEQAPVGIAIARDYKFVSNINPEFMRILGRTKEEIVNSTWTEFTHPDDLEADIANFKKFKSGELTNYSMIKRFLRKDGTAVWVNMVVDQMKLDTDLSNQDTHICIIRDINDNIEAEIALKESERSKAVLLSHLPGIAYRCKFDHAWTMEFISEGCYELTGYRPEQFINNRDLSFDDLICPEYRDYLWKIWSENLKVGKILKEEYQIVDADGNKKWVFEQGQGVYDENNKVIALEGLIIDITESKERELKISYMNDHDMFTDLYNRRYFFEEVKKHDANKVLPISIIVGNINGIRLINNAFGNESGDLLIKETANIMKKTSDRSYTVARIGGDDFCILLPGVDFKEALNMTERIKEECDKFSKKINISFGCATKKQECENILEIYNVAQDNMYKSKLLDRKSSHNDILSTIMATLFAKSQETENHAKRLSEISVKIGKELNLMKHELDLLKLLAMLHDIGKMGIDDQILNKAGKLTEEEWKIMKKHPEIGYKIAISSPELEPIAEYILTHHERWDGEGYPNGVKGDEIPLISRIVSVVDAYDAMTEERIYRVAVSHEKAVQEINRCSGTQFDPKVVEVFNQVVNKGLL